jgi:hypothetical protein
MNEEMGGIAAQDSYDPFAAETFLPSGLKAWTEYPANLQNATNYKKAQSDWFDQLRAAGHDGVVFDNGVRVDFNNANLRSQFAPFDPKNAEKSIIFGGLAGAAPAGVALGSLAAQDNYQPQE